MEDTEAKTILGVRTPVLVVLSSVVFGGLVFAITYLTNRLVRSAKHSDTPKNESEGNRKLTESRNSTNSGGCVSGNSGTSNKRAKNKKRREAQQEFTHSWMVGALKGHTGPVLDMNFSSNGKFLASCAEDCGLVPEEQELDLGGGSSGECVRGNDHGPTASSSVIRTTGTTAMKLSTRKKASTTARTATPRTTAPSDITDDGLSTKKRDDRTILSRRQRKNRTRAPREPRSVDTQRGENEQDHEECYKEDARRSRHRHHHHHYENSPARSTDSSSSSNSSSSTSTSSGSSSSSSSNSSTSSSATPDGTSAGKNCNSRRNHPNKEIAVPRRKCDDVDNESNTGLCLDVKIDIDVDLDTNAHGRYSVLRDELCYLSDDALASLFLRYTLSGEQLAHLGYPVACSLFPGYAIIINHREEYVPNIRRYQRLDVNAREFVPNARSTYNQRESWSDSGNGSGSSVENSDQEPDGSSDSDKNSDIAEAPVLNHRGKPHGNEDSSEILVIVERTCARCSKSFYVNRHDGDYLTQEKCVYHWGRLQHGVAGTNSWSCCRGRGSTKGCTQAPLHVWKGITTGYNGPFEGYVRTKPCSTRPPHRNYGVFALDCEMCFTKRGLEAAKVTVVRLDGRVVYNTLVKPDLEVIDYNTRFSGITAKDLSRATKSLRDVQTELLSFIHAETILIGHGLENDLRSLRMVHTNVIDTCITFPHFMGYPYRCSLKTLAKSILDREIQIREHDSVEDARTAADLMLKRLQRDLL